MKYSMTVLLFQYLLFGILLIKDVFICSWFYAHQVLTKLVRPLYIQHASCVPPRTPPRKPRPFPIPLPSPPRYLWLMLPGAPQRRTPCASPTKDACAPLRRTPYALLRRTPCAPLRRMPCAPLCMTPCALLRRMLGTQICIALDMYMYLRPVNTCKYCILTNLRWFQKVFVSPESIRASTIRM